MAPAHGPYGSPSTCSAVTTPPRWPSPRSGPGRRSRRARRVELVLVGPPQPARARLEALGADPDDPALSYVPAAQGVAMARRARSPPHAAAPTSAFASPPSSSLPAGPTCSLSAGHTGAAVVATSLGVGRESGVARPVLSVALPGSTRPVLLLDAGASLDASPEVLLSHAAAGLRRARAARARPAPRVGLLSIGSRVRQGRRAASGHRPVAAGGARSGLRGSGRG